MNKISIIILVLVILVVFVSAYYLFSNKKDKLVENENTQIANPASVKCINEGGKLEKISFEKGEDNYCVFEDDSKCFEWDFYNGSCKKGDLKITILEEGTGSIAEKGDVVRVHYLGTLTNGTKFDSSYDRGEPFPFVLGENRVIQGWEQGVLGMKVGERRKLTIGSNLGYGTRGAGGIIPPNATLIFEVELLDVSKSVTI